jgi:hypothetical protein
MPVNSPTHLPSPASLRGVRDGFQPLKEPATATLLAAGLISSSEIFALGLGLASGTSALAGELADAAGGVGRLTGVEEAVEAELVAIGWNAPATGAGLASFADGVAMISAFAGAVAETALGEGAELVLTVTVPLVAFLVFVVLFIFVFKHSQDAPRENDVGPARPEQ